MERFRIYQVSIESEKVLIQDVFARKQDAVKFADYAKKNFAETTIYLESLEPYTKEYQRFVIKKREKYYEPPF